MIFFQRFSKKIPEHVLFITIRTGMLLPNQRVGSHCEQPFPIVSPDRPKFKKIAHEARLQVQCLHFERDYSESGYSK
jgi:hypothetical protein